MHVRSRELIAQDEELVRLNDGMEFDPVLRGLNAVIGLATRALPVAEAGSVGRRDDRPSRQLHQNVREEPLPQSQLASAGVLPAQHRMVRNVIKLEVCSQHR